MPLMTGDEWAELFKRQPPPPSPTIPPWVRSRQSQGTGLVNYVPALPPKPEHALPINLEDLADALAEFGKITEARELAGLDVWFVRVYDIWASMGYEIILYEHMGEWKCSSIERKA